jgi:hypothetical protein
MRKNLWAGALLLPLVFIHPARAQNPVESGFGVGAVIGVPTGLSLSLPMGADNAFNLAIGYEPIGEGNLTVVGDYIWHDWTLFTAPSGKLSLYYGPGVRVRLARQPEAGLKGVAGFAYLFEEDPVQIFFEIGPGINVVPDTEARVNAGIGARFFF